MEPKQILVVDDEPFILDLLYRALTRIGDDEFEVESCPSACIALTKLSEHHFDLLITDLQMPDINGLELLRQTRQISPDTHTILITASGSPQVKSEANTLTDAYILKPFEMAALVRTVRAILLQDLRQGLKQDSKPA